MRYTRATYFAGLLALTGAFAFVASAVAQVQPARAAEAAAREALIRDAIVAPAPLPPEWEPRFIVIPDEPPAVLEAYQPVPKTPTAQLMYPDNATGRLVVKLRNDIPARVSNGTIRAAGQPINDVEQIMQQFGLTCIPAINKNDAALQALEDRVRLIAGKEPPRLGNICIITGAPGVIEEAGRRLNDCANVEWVEYEQDMRPNFRSPGVTGACCFGDSTCQDRSIDDCQTEGGVYQGDGTDCATNGDDCLIRVCCVEDVCSLLREDQCDAQGGTWNMSGLVCDDMVCDTEPNCGVAGTGDCFDLAGNGSIYCDDMICCEFICQLDPFCCDEDNPIAEWDTICASWANQFCVSGDPCGNPFGGSCFEEHNITGCNNSACCNTVCMMLDRCCTDGATGWDSTCVMIAEVFCAPPTVDGPTPDYESNQGYLTQRGYIAALGDVLPEPIDDFIPQLMGIPIIGFNGEGWDLEQAGEPFDDLNGNGWWDVGEPYTDENMNGQWDKPLGLWGIAQELLGAYGIDTTGEGNLAKGKTVKVAVIEWAFWEGHEDLGNVTVEDRQTLIKIPSITEPDHATACFGIIGGVDNGFGVTGIAPDADLYFFPLTSVEEGPRELTAWTSALTELGPGDVISCSYGPGAPIYNLNNSQGIWTMIRMASDLGITCCVSAGNDCFNLDGAPDLGDSGGMVVGACSPGAPWYRLTFSNYCTNPDNARSNIVHVKAWGELVTTTGQGVIFFPDAGDGSGGDETRSYTCVFNGTSAAAPQIAGLVAGLQGLAKQFYGVPLSPETIRGVFGAPGIPPANPARLFGGFDESVNCFFDVDPDAGPNMIGVYPNPNAAAAAVIAQSSVGFNDAPLVDDVMILRGDLLYGNKFSIKGSDNSYLVVEAVYTDRNYQPGPGSGRGAGPRSPTEGIAVPQAQSVRYLASGDITDLIVIATSDVSTVNSMTINTEVKYPGVTTLMFVEAYNWRSNTWSFIDVPMMMEPTDDGADYFFQSVAGSPRRFVRESDGRALIRIWTLGLTFGGGNNFGGGDVVEDYLFSVDLVDPRFFEEFGETP